MLLSVLTESSRCISLLCRMKAWNLPLLPRRTSILTLRPSARSSSPWASSPSSVSIWKAAAKRLWILILRVTGLLPERVTASPMPWRHMQVPIIQRLFPWNSMRKKKKSPQRRSTQSRCISKKFPKKNMPGCIPFPTRKAIISMRRLRAPIGWRPLILPRRRPTIIGLFLPNRMELIRL